MIDDWVRTDEALIQVAAVYGNAIMTYNHVLIREDELKPVLPTDRFFLRNGMDLICVPNATGVIITELFKRQDDEYGCANYRIKVKIFNYPDGSPERCVLCVRNNYNRHDVKFVSAIHSVHQFQQALRACGLSDMADNIDVKVEDVVAECNII